MSSLGFLEGAGPMAQFYAEKDWSRTVLGSPDGWSPQLRGYVDMLVRLPTPAILFWGPAQIQLYNLGYSHIMGPRHPRYLGEPYRDCWPDTFDTIYPMMRRVLDQGEVVEITDALIPVTRHGFTEETYFTFSFVPMRGPSGGIEGFIQPVTETTQSLLAARRLATVRAVSPRVDAPRDAVSQALDAFAANPRDLPFAALFTLADDELRLAGQVGLRAEAQALREVAREVFASGQPRLLDALPKPLQGLPLGPWPEPATKALALPLRRSSSDTSHGVAVFGISARLVFDDTYREFFESVVRELSANLTFEQQTKERDRLDQAKTVFFSNVSHELRTPITLMLGPVHELLESADEETRERLEMVQRNGQRLQKLVGSLLDFARIEAGRAQASYRATDLGSFTAELAAAFESVIVGAGLQYQVRCVALSQPVWVDRDMWEKIVLNLLSNAFKFTFEGSIALEMAADERGVAITVRDTGTGIPTAELPNLFKRFHRVQGARSRTHEGSGIGLALSHELVRLHGGSFEVQSVVGQGSAFTVRLPFGVAHLPADRVVTEATAASAPVQPTAYVGEAQRWLPADDVVATEGAPLEARVLLADDNADMRSYVRRVLADRYEVDVAADGVTALKKARAQPPDIIVTDVMMPGLDGFALLKALRLDERTRHVPVVMLSARSGDEDRAVGLEAGANDYLVKPFTPRELLARLEALLRGARERKVEERSRQRLRQLFTHAPVGIALLTGNEHVYELVNDLYGSLIGGRDVVGKPIREALPELEGQGIYELLDRCRQTGEPYVGEEVLVKLDRRGAGRAEDVWFTFIYQPFKDAAGRVEGILVVCTDVTEQVRSREAMMAASERERQARAEAEQANRAKDEFLAMLGHELRNPLAPIVSALSIMKLKGAGHDKEREIIERQTNHLVTLVDDLLDVSRITRGKIELKRVNVELCEVVAQAVEVTSTLLERRHHRLHLELPASGLLVHADRGRLQQILSNLISNAAKYTDSGGAVWIVGSRDGDEVVLTVRDNGIGIAPAMLPRVFELFSQAEQALDRAQGGLGLGLAIVKGLVTMHGGTVTARSEGQGRGSEFELRLPAASAAVAQGPVGHRAIESRVAPARQKVLVVDDNQDAALSVSELLELMGCEVKVAFDGAAALQIAPGFRPDVALLDIGLPSMDGYELARRMRGLEGAKDARLIALTGYGQESDRQRSQAAGFDLHVTKPITYERLCQVIGPPTTPAA